MGGERLTGARSEKCDLVFGSERASKQKLGLAAVFLDRDGVINRNIFNPDTGAYEAPHRVADVDFLPGALEALSQLQTAGWPLFLISNQPDHALGKASLETIQAIHAEIVSRLAAAGVMLREAYYCYHHPNGVTPGYSGACVCRKPSPYFLHKARDAHDLDLAACWMVGDRASDIACGQAGGLRTIQVAPDHPSSLVTGGAPPHHHARDLAEAVAIILA
jgi:D-glycero-D-manno-heptose 1,7-bisphosphate phosphatase